MEQLPAHHINKQTLKNRLSAKKDDGGGGRFLTFEDSDKQCSSNLSSHRYSIAHAFIRAFLALKNLK